MRIYSICRKCAEVHPAELECAGCCAIGTLPARPAAPVIRSRRPAPEAGPSSFPSDGTIARFGMARASALVVSAYLFAVVVLIIAVFARA